jgi:hypothetical protein
MSTILRVKNKIILLIGMSFFCLFILYSYVFAAEITEFNKKYKFIAEDPGVQRLYLDTKNIVKNKNIATIAMINLFIKDGKLYQAYKSKFPKQNPSHSISEMELNCKSMQIRVKEFKLYNSDDEIIANYSVDKKWKQVQIKNTTDKFIFEAACK